MTRKPFRLAAAAVSGLAITTLAFGAPAAFADTGDQTKVDGVSQAAGNPSLVNPTATVQLNIQMHLGATTGQPNNGTVQSVTTPKLQGVNFDGTRIEYADGWVNVRKSNTEPYLRLIVEARDAELLGARLALLAKALAPFGEKAAQLRGLAEFLTERKH